MALAVPDRLARRLVMVTIGPPGGVGRKFLGELSETRPGLHITASVEHTSGPRPNKGKFKIHNLGDDSARFIESKNFTIQVAAGENVAGSFFRGDITRAETRQEGPTRVTAIEAAEGRRIWATSTIARSWPANTTRDQVLSDVLVAMGAARGFISPRLARRIFATGLMWAGLCRDLLDLLFDADALPFAERWTMTANAVDVLVDGETRPGNALLLSPTTGLIGSPSRTKGGGAKFKAVLSQSMRPGGGVQLAAKFITGIYRLVKVAHEVDSRGLVWQTSGEAVRP